VGHSYRKLEASATTEAGGLQTTEIVIANARPNVSLRDTRTLEDIIAEYQDTIETKIGD